MTFSKSARKEVIVRAYRDHGYFQTAIAKEAGLHYSTVSRIISRGWPFSKDKTLTPHPWQLNFGTIDILYLTAHDYGGFHACTEEPGSTMHSLLQKIHRSGNWPTFEHMSGKNTSKIANPNSKKKGFLHLNISTGINGDPYWLHVVILKETGTGTVDFYEYALQQAGE